MAFVFDPPPQVSLPIQGRSERLPVRRVYCVGRNYAEHSREMGHDPDREEPFFFQKNPDNLVQDGRFPYPSRTKDVHHEVELVVALKKGGENIPVEAALDHVFGYATGVDMTRRDLQAQIKKTAKPWTPAKAFEHSAPISPIVEAARIGHPSAGRIWLAVNDETRQEGDLAQLIWKVPEIIAHLSSLFRLAPGDLVMTGTPAGVGAVVRGDRVAAGVDGIATLVFDVV